MSVGTRTCAWVVTPASHGVRAVYCGKKSTFKIVQDEDGSEHRKYSGFCKTHDKPDQEADE